MTINVYPGATNPTHEISLSDGVRTFGLHLDGGPEALREEPLTPSTLRLATGPSGFGAWEPGMAQIEQRDWSGGRGLEIFSADDTENINRFYDSLNAWTLPLVNALKQLLGVEGKAAVWLTAAVAAVLGLTATLVGKGFDPASMTPEQLFAAFGQVLAAATLAYKLLAKG